MYTKCHEITASKERSGNSSSKFALKKTLDVDNGLVTECSMRYYWKGEDYKQP